MEEKNKIFCTIEEPLPTLTYKIEVTTASYVFPSDSEVRIKIIKRHEEYIPIDPLGKILTEPEIRTLINDPEYIEKIRGLPGELSKDSQDGKDRINGKDGDQGPQGNPGASAYEIWLGEDSLGSEQDFLASLKTE